MTAVIRLARSAGDRDAERRDVADLDGVVLAGRDRLGEVAPDLLGVDHGVLGGAVRVGDLGGGQATHRAQGERHLGRGAERGVTAEHQQREAVVDGRWRARVAGWFVPGQLGQAGFLFTSAPGLLIFR